LDSKSSRAAPVVEKLAPAQPAKTLSDGPRAAWPHFLIPSVTDLIFAVLLISLTYGTLSQRLLGDADIGWHIRDGQQITTTHTLPRNDSFSSTRAGKPWYAWEWLYDCGVALIHRQAGLNGVVLLTALIIAFTFTLFFRMQLTRGTNLPIAVLLLLLAASASTIHFLARPHVVSWLLTLIWFHFLDSAETTSRLGEARKLYWLPFLMLLWVNLHGGFIMGFVLLGVFLLAAAMERFASGDPEVRTSAGKRVKALGSVGVFCLLASLVNPYGYKLHFHVYSYLSSRFLMDHIDEFHSPNFHGVAERCFAAVVLIAIFSVAVSMPRLRQSHLLLLMFAVYSGLYASRNIPIASILITLVIAPLLSSWFDDLAGQERSTSLRRLASGARSFARRMYQMESMLRGHLVPAIVVVFSLWVCFHNGRLGSRELMHSEFDAKRFPVRAVDLLMRRQVRDPVFSPDSWGGFLIYRMYPETKVIVDDRHDFYGETFLKDYLRVIHVQPGWDKILDGWNVNWAVLPAESALSSTLKEVPRWKIIHDDGVAILFQRGRVPEQ
jgi:hypothetical protein